MKITKKVIVLLVAVMMVIGCSIGGTVAWLATKTEAVVNTFTVGNINIKLEEHVLDPETGKIDTLADPPYTTSGNQNIKMMPGRTIQKDPTVTVLKNSEKCYVRMYMIISWSDKADGEFSGDDAEGWLNINKSSWIAPEEPYIDRTTGVAKVNIYEFRYKTAVNTSTDDQPLEALFTEITIPGTLTGDQYEGLKDGKIEILAQAVQADGFDTAAAAFEKAGTPSVIEGLITQYYPSGRDPKPNQNQGN